LKKDLYIKAHCKIKNNQLFFNDELLFKDEEAEDLKSFLKSTYKFLELKYGKFFKMDSLSKLTFLASEIVLTKTNAKEETENIALVFSNNASSLETDRKHQKSIDNLDDYFPSPAIFVYTLPNIGIGEVSIRHQLKSENAFFVFNEYNADFHTTYESSLIQSNKAEAVLAGWTNVDNDKNYEAFVYLVSTKGKIEHNKKELNQIYTNKN